MGGKNKRLEMDEADDGECVGSGGDQGAVPGEWRRQDPGKVGSKIPPFLQSSLTANDQVIIYLFIY